MTNDTALPGLILNFLFFLILSFFETRDVKYVFWLLTLINLYIVYIFYKKDYKEN